MYKKLPKLDQIIDKPFTKDLYESMFNWFYHEVDYNKLYAEYGVAFISFPSIIMDEMNGYKEQCLMNKGIERLHNSNTAFQTVSQDIIRTSTKDIFKFSQLLPLYNKWQIDQLLNENVQEDSHSNLSRFNSEIALKFPSLTDKEIIEFFTRFCSKLFKPTKDCLITTVYDFHDLPLKYFKTLMIGMFSKCEYPLNNLTNNQSLTYGYLLNDLVLFQQINGDEFEFNLVTKDSLNNDLLEVSISIKDAFIGYLNETVKEEQSINMITYNKPIITYTESEKSIFFSIIKSVLNQSTDNVYLLGNLSPKIKLILIDYLSQNEQTFLNNPNTITNTRSIDSLCLIYIKSDILGVGFWTLIDKSNHIKLETTKHFIDSFNLMCIEYKSLIDNILHNS